jgi:hypothetical protein
MKHSGSDWAGTEKIWPTKVSADLIRGSSTFTFSMDTLGTTDPDMSFTI